MADTLTAKAVSELLGVRTRELAKVAGAARTRTGRYSVQRAIAAYAVHLRAKHRVPDERARLAEAQRAAVAQRDAIERAELVRIDLAGDRLLAIALRANSSSAAIIGQAATIASIGTAAKVRRALRDAVAGARDQIDQAIEEARPWGR